jgi:hypothetical protein
MEGWHGSQARRITTFGNGTSRSFHRTVRVDAPFTGGGASPNCAMRRIAIPQDGQAVTWLEQVTDEQYGKEAL